MRDLIIVGGGAAGLASAIYAARYKLDTLLISKHGGAAIGAPWIENYPGFEKIAGMDLISKFEAQAANLGIETISEEVTSISKKKNSFVVEAGNKKYESKTIILALGREKTRLNLENESKYLGRGISYCATCDAPVFNGKTVAVVGGSIGARRSRPGSAVT